MGLLVFVRNLLLALCLFLVLGFLYYSAWKLHLFQWEDSNSVVLSFDSAGQTLGSEYDRLGFLLKLDSKLPAELATKYANFSEGTCKPGYASALMTVIFPRFSKPAPMFLDDSFRKWARIREFVPPFGIKGQDNLIKAILSVTKEYRLTPALDSLSCRRCIIVGNGGVLANKSLGSRIDDYDIVVRLNSAPVKGFEKDVGSKTTLRITYPEGAMQRPEQYERDSLFVLAGFKWQDFKWLKYIVYKERVRSPVCLPNLSLYGSDLLILNPVDSTLPHFKGTTCQHIFSEHLRCTVRNERVRWLLEICGHSGAQGTP
ncbi:CMP-N-acetylneuraminate-beta-1,4-galactoside alpha-2,3-sialyltransferase isoform X4 [Physeter macrocephalus]|uniref:CMP-N-acetylneuraminate-beta-1,4-galactoside alpha-2,3-sialyltransferase isoform X4 n=1 Tax=Physeter macrocephalus TaxID=9755 RepID=A0A455BAI2_PHYMC|nr:CMP-N-acetylneuraminate-beta-1,4-galactoside alpha-2,3-sialyltransferase isoform X4 [Physeter catodon]|eukprot:XP_028340986.1 CMP-N-acetylneuraminate-beta-1,4-galactoside alpha-2,3-sialyltransferase isoform X4 [Physeter catodon]